MILSSYQGLSQDTRVYGYNAETKVATIKMEMLTFSKIQEGMTDRCATKSMLIIFLDKDVVHWDFVPLSQAINADFIVTFKVNFMRVFLIKDYNCGETEIGCSP